MADRTSMRPRKGDFFVEVRNHEGSMKYLLDKEKITDAHHEAMQEISTVVVDTLVRANKRTVASVHDAAMALVDEGKIAEACEMEIRAALFARQKGASMVSLTILLQSALNLAKEIPDVLRRSDGADE